MYRSGSKFLTSPPICESNALTSNAVMRAMPDFPAEMFAQFSRDGISARGNEPHGGDDHSSRARGHGTPLIADAGRRTRAGYSLEPWDVM